MSETKRITNTIIPWRFGHLTLNFFLPPLNTPNQTNSQIVVTKNSQPEAKFNEIKDQIKVKNYKFQNIKKHLGRFNCGCFPNIIRSMHVC